MTNPALRTGRRIRLRHLAPADLPVLHRLATDPQVRDTWRTRGDLWSFAQLEQHLTADPHVGLVVTALDADEPIGLVELHDVDLLDARAQLAILVHPWAWSAGIAGEAAVLFAGFAFAALPLDKLACTVQASNDRAVPALRRTLDHEGTLRRHLNVHGRWIDLELFALWRERLPEIEARLGRSSSVGAGEQCGTLRSSIELVLADSGLAPERLATVTFRELDSLAVLEVIVATEERIGRPLAIEAFDLDQPVVDLLSFAGEAASTAPAAPAARTG
jgi:RimJ/RimL family protein N-acetyltransferase/acyl carrier protein